MKLTKTLALESLVVMATDIGPEGQASFPDAAKHPPNACDVRARKIRGSECPIVRH